MLDVDGIPPERELTDAGAGDAATGLRAAAMLAPALALAACGGGGTGSTATTTVTAPVATATPAPSAPVVVVPAAVTTQGASRMLAQATMGATKDMIATVVARGYAGWIDDQLAMPRATSHWDWLVANGYNAAANINGETGFDQTMWRQLIVEPDQLRQRVGMALLDILVVGIGGVNLNWKQFATAAYVDVLLDNAFGNYRDLLTAITGNAAMGSYLTFIGNKKANAATGAVPDENYARELMQLFTLGLYRLDMDGSVRMAGGQPLESYTQADVSGLARVFTGLNLASTVSTTPDRYRLPLVMTAAQHETGSSTVLGTTISSEGTAASHTTIAVPMSASVASSAW